MQMRSPEVGGSDKKIGPGEGQVIEGGCIYKHFYRGKWIIRLLYYMDVKDKPQRERISFI